MRNRHYLEIMEKIRLEAASLSGRRSPSNGWIGGCPSSGWTAIGGEINDSIYLLLTDLLAFAINLGVKVTRKRENSQFFWPKSAS